LVNILAVLIVIIVVFLAAPLPLLARRRHQQDGLVDIFDVFKITHYDIIDNAI
jgi:hypothetical protein